jgi:hypothetical protein
MEIALMLIVLVIVEDRKLSKRFPLKLPYALFIDHFILCCDPAQLCSIKRFNISGIDAKRTVQ